MVFLATGCQAAREPSPEAVPEGDPPPCLGTGWPEVNQCFPEITGLPIRVAPPLLLPVLADFAGGGGGGSVPCYHDLLEGRMPAERHKLGEASALHHRACSARCLLPAETLAPDHVCCRGMPPCWACIAPRKLCSYRGAEGGRQQHHESSRFTLSFKSLDHIFAFCFRPQLSHIKQKSSQAQ